MAHCAEINNQNIVVRVIVVDDFYGDLTCEQWCEKTYGGVWKKTSYNTKQGKHLLGGIPFRKNYAGIGMKYDEARNAFIPRQPYPSWVLNEKTCDWEAPVKYPKDAKPYPFGEYDWDEKTLKWVKN